LRIVAEEMQPKRWENCDNRADRSGDAGSDEAAGPGNSFGAGDLTSAHVDAHHGQNRGADAEQDRDHDVVEPRGDAIGGERGGAEKSDGARHQDHRQIGEDRAGCA
jgi:hypothetical protein